MHKTWAACINTSMRSQAYAHQYAGSHTPCTWDLWNVCVSLNVWSKVSQLDLDFTLDTDWTASPLSSTQYFTLVAHGFLPFNVCNTCHYLVLLQTWTEQTWNQFLSCIPQLRTARNTFLISRSVCHEIDTHTHFTIILCSSVDKEQFFQTLQQNTTHSHLLVGHSDQTVTLDSWRVSYDCENNTRPRPIWLTGILTPPTHSIHPSATHKQEIFPCKSSGSGWCILF